MKGMVLVVGGQTKDGIFWTEQDQNYLPRLMNYLNIEFMNYDWEAVPIYELTEKRVQSFTAVAITPISRGYSKKVVELNSSIKVIPIDKYIFIHQIAPKGAVIGRSTGYILVNRSKMSQKGIPKETEIFTYESLRQVMREYPTIYWEVLSIEKLKERLNQNAEHVTIGLIPKAYLYEEELKEQFPEAKVLKLLPKTLEEIPVIYEKVMLLTAAVTIVLMTLRVFFY